MSVKIIETNLSLNPNDELTIMDHQARVIEVESWESYIEEILSGDMVYRSAAIGSGMGGYSFPKGIIEDFKSDNRHLSYTTTNEAAVIKSLAYLVE